MAYKRESIYSILKQQLTFNIFLKVFTLIATVYSP